MARTILLSGACGSGKSTLMNLGYRALERHLGPTAVIDTDTVLMMVDPRWELSHEERRLDLAGYQCFLLARSFLDAGFQCVIIGGNGLHTPDEINDLIALLLDVGDVFHVTLDPALTEIQSRVANRGGDQTPEWLADHVQWMRARYRSWTCCIDNTELSPEATIAQVAERTAGGEGKVIARLPAL
ncbi:MAG: AAA family ATPase [Acidimicrobiia bacterium]